MVEKSYRELIDDLKSSSTYRRTAAAAALGKLGERRAYDSLVDALNDPDSTVRDNAAYALGEMGVEDASPHLEKLVDDPDEWARKGAVKALGILKSSRSVNRLVETLGADASSIVRRAAARSLGQIGDASAADSLKKALNDEDSMVQDMAKQVLFMIESRVKNDD